MFLFSNQFLAVAEDLRVKGLTQGNSNSDNKPKSDAKPRSVPSVSRDTELPANKRQRLATPAAPAASYQEDDEIQEVVPVKTEPPVADNSGYLPAGDQQGTVALDDAYNEESYDYGQYGEAGYDDGSGMIDPNTGMPLVGADGNKGKDLSDFNHIKPTLELHLLLLYSAHSKQGHMECNLTDFVSWLLEHTWLFFLYQRSKSLP